MHAKKTIQKKKTSTGLAEPTNHSGQEKCGGAVAKVQKKLSAANSRNTPIKKMMMKMKIK